ncbi:hypothetical protein N7478_010689 [Penicillium angulare]|uniref:uncharacterized protein n=1 Tax=Penicillium angulare TaxID=116970 RepID=UPI00254081FF|nr:uncharacterized protein N7478_010689 [Penicillium angulare]KAJ5267881.1 hypothetical protein N7478_010689 [Penicillium angulare]
MITMRPVNFDHPSASYYSSKREPGPKEATREEPHYYRHDLVPGHRCHGRDKYQGRNHHNDHHYRHHKDDRHHRHLVEGAIAGVEVAKMIHKYRRTEGEEVSHGLGHFAYTLGAGALGAVVVNEASP